MGTQHSHGTCIHVAHAGALQIPAKLLRARLGRVPLMLGGLLAFLTLPLNPTPNPTPNPAPHPAPAPNPNPNPKIFTPTPHPDPDQVASWPSSRSHCSSCYSGPSNSAVPVHWCPSTCCRAWAARALRVPTRCKPSKESVARASLAPPTRRAHTVCTPCSRRAHTVHTHAPCVCHACAMRVLCVCHACAIPVPCLRRAYTMPVPTIFLPPYN